MPELREDYDMPEGVESWYTDFVAKTTEWVHAIISDKIDIKFKVNVKNTETNEFIEFLDKNLGDIVSTEVRDKILENFICTKEVLDTKSDQPSFIANMLPGVNNVVTHPVSGKEQRLFDIIINLNDHCGWTREAVADWIDTLPEVPVFELEPTSNDRITVLEHTIKTSK